MLFFTGLRKPQKLAQRAIRQIFFSLVVITGMMTTNVGHVWAVSGLPGSAEFGYGARLDPWGQSADIALKVAANVGMQWIGIDYDWQLHWPDPASPPDLAALDQVMGSLRLRELPVSIAISHPPAWAQTPQGPDPEHTANLVALLATRYPATLQAIELFPEANTSAGWGAPPNPTAYVALLQKCQDRLDSLDQSVILVAGGLIPLAPGHRAEDMDDLAFLSALYDAGATAYMPVVSIRLTNLTGEPKATPSGTTPPVLRHYESVRQVMIAHQHNAGLIWITGYHWPLEPQYNNAAQATRWLGQALQLMKSQLYIGAAFFVQLNQAAVGDLSAPIPALVHNQNGATSLHAALETFGQMIQFGHTSGSGQPQQFIVKILVGGSLKTAKMKSPI